MIHVSKETAKLLNDAGWKEKTFFAYTEKSDDPVVTCSCPHDVVYAPTAQELIDELPLNTEGGHVTITKCKDEDGNVHNIITGVTGGDVFRFNESNLVEAIAALWISIQPV